MYTAQLRESESGQVVTLPSQSRLYGKEVYVHNVAGSVMLTPKDTAWNTFLNGLDAFSDDYMADGRQ